MYVLKDNKGVKSRPDTVYWVHSMCGAGRDTKDEEIPSLLNLGMRPLARGRGRCVS